MKTSWRILGSSAIFLASSAPMLALAQDELEELPGIEELPGVEELPGLESYESLEALDASSAEDTSPVSITLITHVRSYSLFGASLVEVDGELEASDLALVIQRVRPVLSYSVSDWLRIELAYDVIPLIGASQSVGSFAVQDVGLSALRLVDFGPTLYAPGSGSWVVQHNLDRLSVRIGRVGREVQVGRQAFNHGSARLFPATDIFAPFGPGTIDTEFKRGVDGARVTYALRENHEVELYAIAHEPDLVADLDEGELSPGQWMYLVRWRGLFPELFDASIYAGSSYAQPTVGVDLSTSLKGAAVYAESSARFAVGEDQDTSVQATVGADYQWELGLTTTLEVYYSSLGERAPFERALTAPSLPRQVGELNYFGSWYAGASVGYSWERASVGGAYIQNLQDASSLLTASLSYDMAQDVGVGAGAIVPLGKRSVQAPVPQVRSEFGLFPLLAFADIRMAF